MTSILTERRYQQSNQQTVQKVETMFRKYFEERGMTDPRDSWYKPNMLYNIHYKPPTPRDPPRFKVVTKKFNPSVCTCGEHGCEPRYRMEREVVWLKKEIEGENGKDVENIIQDKEEVATDAEMRKETDRLAESYVGDIQEDNNEGVLKCDIQTDPTRPGDDVNDAEDSVETLDVDNDCGAAFGILSVFCCSELHTAWAG